MKPKPHQDPLKPRDRVYELLAGAPVDRTPIGEILVCDQLIRELTGLRWDQPVSWAARRAVIERLGHDVVTVSFINQPLDDALFWVRQWRKETDLFVVALISGLLTQIVRIWGREAARDRLCTDPTELASLFAESMLELQHLADQIADAGADAIMMNEPLTGPEGMHWPAECLRTAYFPFLTLLAHAVHQADLFFFVRAPGPLSPILKDLMEAGVDGIQGLCAGDPDSWAAVRAIVGPQLCLWGGVDAYQLSLPQTAPRLLRQLRPWNSGPTGVPTILGTRHGLTEDLSIAEVEQLDAIWATLEGTPRRLGVSSLAKDRQTSDRL